MAIQFSGGVAHKHHRGNKHCKHDDLNEALLYLEYGTDDEHIETYKTQWDEQEGDGANIFLIKNIGTPFTH